MGDAAEDGQHEFAGEPAGVQTFFLEVNGNAQGFQLPDVFEAFHRIPCKAGYGLGEDAFDFPLLAVLDQPQEFRPLMGAGSRYALIGIDTCQRPLLVALDLPGIFFHLGGKGVALILRVRADPAVSRHPLPAMESRLVACYIGA